MLKSAPTRKGGYKSEGKYTKPPGADPEIEEGGAYIYVGGWCGTHSAQLAVHV